MEKTYIISYKVLNGGGSKKVILDLPDDATNISIECENNFGTYVFNELIDNREFGGGGSGGHSKTIIK